MFKCYPINPGKESVAVHVLREFGEELSHQHKVCLLQELILVQAQHTKGSSEEEPFSIPENQFGLPVFSGHYYC